MIIENYSTFRALANFGGAIGTDGLTEFDPDRMRADNFDDGIEVVTSPIAFPLELTCNGGDPDTLAGTDEYDWYVSQRTSVVADKPFTISRADDLPTDSFSGTIAIDATVATSTEYPDPFDLSTIRVLFFAIDIYAIRKRDFAIQRFDLMKYLIDQLSPKTDLE
jgi:hypothetical protein